MLRDLEEVVLLVQDDAVRSQMREAVRCYHAGAYRAAVVMAVAAGMYDLRRRVDELVTTGAGNLRRLRDDVDAKANNEEAWEQMLLDGCKRDDLVSSSDYQKLCLLLKTRHLCAHPTGHVGSAEEGRDAIASLIDLVLSKPTQAGGREVTELVKHHLPQGQYLAGSPTEVVIRELSRLQPRVFGFLAREVAGKLGDADRDLAKNAAIFVAEMTKLHAGHFSEAAAVAIVEIERMLATGTAATLLPVFRHAPESLAQLDTIARGRLVDVLCRNPFRYMRTTDELVLSGVLSEAEHATLLLKAEAISCDAMRAGKVLTDIRWPDLRSRVSDWLIENMASTHFDTANSAVGQFADLVAGKALGDWSGEVQARAILAVAHSARHGVFRSEQVCREGVPASMMVPVLNRLLESSEPSLDEWDMEEFVTLARNSVDRTTIVDYLERLLDGSAQPSPKQVRYREDFLLCATKDLHAQLQEVVNMPGVDFGWLEDREYLHGKLVKMCSEVEPEPGEFDTEAEAEPEAESQRS